MDASSAIVELMYLAANTDGEFKNIEALIIKTKIASYTKVFKNIDANEVKKITENLIKRVRSNSLEELIDYYSKKIPSNLKLTAYAYALEICARDFQLHESELKFLRLLYTKFNIPKGTHQALIKSINIRCLTNFDATDTF